MRQTLETTPLLLLNLVLMVLNLGGVCVNGWMVGLTTQRKRRIGDVALSQTMKITTHRALRMEIGFFACQVIMLVLSAWSLAKVLPSAPDGAITYYFVTQVGRSTVSAILAVISLLDLRDRNRIIAIYQQTPPP